jgi:hypothetical protein
MDNGEKERAVANRLKETVKQSSRLKPAVNSGVLRNIAPKSSDGSVKTTTPDVESSGSSQTSEKHHIQGVQIIMSPDESVLLMHFMDVVFHLQYPVYKPKLQYGGRGWFLPLVLQNKPLFYAVLALSAYHRRMTLYPDRLEPLIQQEKHLEIAIKSIYQATNNSCPRNGLAVMTTIIQLLYLELYTGHDKAWKAHLDAAAGMFQKSLTMDLTSVGFKQSTHDILRQNREFSVDDPQVTAEVMNFHFLESIIIWLDITSAITACTAPKMLQHLSIGSQVGLEDVIGCANCIMLQIGSIAVLHHSKLQKGHLGPEDEQMVCDIAQQLQNAILYEEASSGSVSAITRVFTHMAQVYLHLVVYDLKEPALLAPIFDAALEVLRTQLDTDILPALVLPLFILGSVALEEEEGFFRSLFSSPPLLNPILSHRLRLLPALEEVWTSRRTLPGFSWKKGLELVDDILLL